MKRIKDLPKLDRPREKLQAKGAQALSEFELLEVIIGSGNGLMVLAAISMVLFSKPSAGLPGTTQKRQACLPVSAS